MEGTEHVEVELRAEIVVLEAILLAFMTHLAAHAKEPNRFATDIMRGAAAHLADWRSSATSDFNRKVGALTDVCFGEMSDALVAHVTRYAQSHG